MLCVITGVLRTPNGAVHPSATVKFRRAAPVHGYVAETGPAVVIPDEVVVTSDVDGEVVVSLYPGRYQVELLGSAGVKYNFTVSVPLEATLSFVELLVQAPDYPYGGQLDTIAGYAAQAYASMVAAGLSEVAAETVAAGLDPSAVVITGGTINGTPIGGTTRAAAAFTTLALTTDLPVTEGGTGASTLTGLVKGNGTAAFTAAVAGTDYLAPAVVGVSVQAFDAGLTSIAGLSPIADRGIYATGVDTFALFTLTAAGRAFLDDADAAAQLTTLGVSAFAQTLLDDASQSAMRTTLGLVIGTDVMSHSLSAPLADPALTGIPTAPTAAPGTNTTQIATTAFVKASSNLTLLGTLTTNTGSSQTLSGLVLTNYKFLRLVFVGVSAGTSGNITVGGSTVAVIGGGGNTSRGIVEVDLTEGTFSAILADAGSSIGAAATPYAGDTTLTTASTSIVVAVSTGSFDAGSVRIYGE